MRSRTDRDAGAVPCSFSFADAPDQRRPSASPKAQRALRGADNHADAILSFPVITAPQVSMASFVWRGTRCSPR